MRRLPDALSGLAPAPSAACPRCGAATTALANGRGRLDICESCGTLEMVTPEGLELLHLRGRIADLSLRGATGKGAGGTSVQMHRVKAKHWALADDD